MNEVTFEIVKIALCAVVSILAIVFTRVLVPYIKSITLTQEQETVMQLVEIAVRAFEQTVKESGQGKIKKQQVIAFVRGELQKKGITVTEDQLDKLIESSVYILKKEQEALKEGEKE